MDLEILDRIQRKILTLLRIVPHQEIFYLTGGTALSAFYLFHRKSQDLDFFTASEESIPPFSFELEKTLKKEGFELERRRGLRSFVELAASSSGESTIIHLALDSPYRLESLRDFEEFQGIKIDNLFDIAANKLLTLFGRAYLRDFIDVYFLISEKFSKKELIDMARKKDPGFDIYWLGTAFGRISEFPANSPEMHLLMKPCPLDELQNFFREWKGEIFKEITKE